MDTQMRVKCARWAKKINRKYRKKTLIKIVNEVDKDEPPNDFTYIVKSTSKLEWIRGDIDPLVGCECEECPTEACCPMLAVMNGKIAYTPEGLLKTNTTKPIFECNSACKCGKTCINRVVQKGMRHRMEIFKKEDKRLGWAVRTLEPIRKGEFVVEYVGEIIFTQELDVREADGGPSVSYAFDLNFGENDSYYAIDSFKYGNVSRFVNHSCSPNLKVHPVFINNIDPRLPRLAFFATRDIEKGEELTFNYSASKTRNKRTRRVDCLCGSAKCRKYV